MCRLLGIASEKSRPFRPCLLEAPRSLEALGRDHGDGWGIAVHEDGGPWRVAKRATSASADPAFRKAAGKATGSLLIAHVRKRTVGPVGIENTHPFQFGRWVFAHNGTIVGTHELRAAYSATRVFLRGTTDSEVLFAFLMQRLAEGLDAPRTRTTIDVTLVRAIAELGATPAMGAATFLMSDGEVLYAFRSGRPLYILERRSQDRLDAILVASEPVSADEPWAPIAEGTLLAVRLRPRLGWAPMIEVGRSVAAQPLSTASQHSIAEVDPLRSPTT